MTLYLLFLPLRLPLLLFAPLSWVSSTNTPEILYSRFDIESHVIHIPWGSSLLSSTNARLKLQKRKNYVQHDENAQLMISMNDTIYETYGGNIYCDHSKRKVKIIHSELLYTLPGNPTCTHLLLYIDQPLIDLATKINDKLISVYIIMWSYPVTLWLIIILSLFRCNSNSMNIRWIIWGD